MTTPDTPDVPDDLSGLHEPPQMRLIGDIDPALMAAYDQLLEFLRQVSHRLFFLSMVVQEMNPDDEEDRTMIQAAAQEASDMTWALDERSKVILINILIGQLTSAATFAIDQGWQPSDPQLDDPVAKEQMAHIMGIPMNMLEEMVEKMKARRVAEGGTPQPDPTTDPPA